MHLINEQKCDETNSVFDVVWNIMQNNVDIIGVFGLLRDVYCTG
jgi:hypothetical protein